MDSDQPQPAPTVDRTSAVCSGLSGNEMYCAALIGLTPGNLLIGNSVFSMGILGGLRSSVKTTVGGEIRAYTDMIKQGRELAFYRLKAEQQQHQGSGVTGVSNELVFHGNNIEFLSIGSAVHSATPISSFTTSADAQELFCQVDAGYQPISFVFGNVAYSIGVAGHIMANIRQLARGEVRAYSDLFNTTRNLALQRIVKDAELVNANAVIGIETTILPFGTSGVQEMVMIGTASKNPLVSSIVPDGIITSDLTAEETWNITKLGYMPLQLVLGTSVYSLGVIGGLKSALKEMVHGEVSALTQVIYGARENSIAKLKNQASAVNADDVLGVKTYVYQLGGDLIELLAIGTAVKRMEGITTRSPQLPPQAIIRDKDTFINTAELHFGVDLNTESVNN
jgi:uncharacterized protein YbjQ (UPF0145 family)